MRAMIDATSALLRAIAGRFDGLAFVVEEIQSRSWASATFSGARHELTFRLEGDGAGRASEAFLADMEAAEFNLRGHVLADIALLFEERPDEGHFVRISLEALTVEED